MTSPEVALVESLQSRVDGLIDFQVGILDSLKKGMSPENVAGLARDFLIGVYGNGNMDSSPPSGADLGFSVNNSCNLKCPHCYYHNTHNPGSLEGGALNEEQWREVTSQAIDLGFHHLSVVGKEALLSPRKTEAIIETISQKRSQGIPIKYEIITNGTKIKQNIGWLGKYPDFYFFSVSVDGHERDHDKIRGDGNYRKSLEGITSARDAGIKNLTAIFTAMPHNVESLERMTQDLSEAGVKYLTIGYCFPTEYNNQGLTAGLSLFDRTVEIARKLPPSLGVSLNLLGDEHAGIIAKLYNRGFFTPEKLVATGDLAPSILVPISERSEKSPRANVLCTILPTVFYSGFRVDYDGTAMDFCADLRGGEKRGFGNVKNKTISALYQESRNIWEGYTVKYYERLARALKGESVGPVKGWYDMTGVKT